jgi:hypothetical protein
MAAALIVLIAAPAMAKPNAMRAIKTNPGKRAPCVSGCSGRYGSCGAGVAYDKGKPWIDEQVKIAKKFFEELLKKFDDKYPPPLQTKLKNI